MWERQPPLGITTGNLKGRRRLARGCVDWTMRRPHLAGALGAALIGRMPQLDWIARRQPTERALSVTPAGATGIAEVFGVTEDILAR